MRKPLKTYSHLAGERRMPSEYEIVSTKLLWYVERGFEVRTKLDDWYAKHQRGSRLHGPDWDSYRDPRATTYADYVALQERREIEVDGCFRGMDVDGYEEALAPSWALALETFAALRYPLHGLSMLAAYAGQMAPSGTLTIVSAFQAADERRRVERVAYRIAMRRRSFPSFAEGSKERWMREPALQPLRELIERLLVAYDWGESLVATNLAVKPVLDALFFRVLAGRARSADDPLFARVLGILDEDSSWHVAHTLAAIELARAMDPDHAAVVREICDTWTPRALEAARALAPAFGASLNQPGDLDSTLDARVRALHAELAVRTSVAEQHGGGR